MADEIKCVECKKEMKLLPQRQSLPETTAMTSTVYVDTYTGIMPSFPPTSKTFKCSNPECWVTKMELSWS